MKIVQAATSLLTLPRGSTIVVTAVEYFVLIASPKASAADLIRGRQGSAKYAILCEYIVNQIIIHHHHHFLTIPFGFIFRLVQNSAPYFSTVAPNVGN